MNPDLMHASRGDASAVVTDAQSGTAPRVWVVRADGGKYADDFVSGGYAAVGWFDLSSIGTRDQLRKACELEYPDAPAGQIANVTGQLGAFRLEMHEGDYVVTPTADPESLRYGRIIGPCFAFEGDDGCSYRNRRAVDWAETRLSRLSFGESFRRTLGSPRTVFRVSQSEEFIAAVARAPDVSQDDTIDQGSAGVAAFPVQHDIAPHIAPEALSESARPLPGTIAGQLWDIADKISREKGSCAERGEIIERFAAQGGNKGTASTLYYKWKRHYDARTLSEQAFEVEPLDVIEDHLSAPEDDDVEPNSGVEEEREDPDAAIKEPFDPSKIKVRTLPVLVDQLVERIRHDEIDLAPDFQRMRGIWKPVNKSRLIESLLLRIPIPVFYVAADIDDNWEVVDGVQRMSTLYDYVTDQFALGGLEYRVEFNGKRFGQLPRVMQRRIRETQLVVNVIEPGTPPEVMFNIFSRINTGGMKLNAQEIRHALHPGPVRDFLKTLANSDAFTEATNRSIKPDRMIDRECVLRFLAFHIEHWEKYKSRSLDGYLTGIMKRINAMTPSERDLLRADFEKAMLAAKRIFGRKAFRNVRNERARINKPLLEAWGVQLARCSPREIDQLVAHRTDILERLELLLQDPDFDKSISQSTAMPQRIRKRFTAVRDLVQEFV